jgi:crotonobetainyl-CoA:carnitine CoA-transferase CaiB-like acyl-CoA transferase
MTEGVDDASLWPARHRPGPLAGVRIVDLSRVLAGPLCTCTLGDLGADVIKVERPGVGDDTRHWGPPWHGDDAAYFFAINRNRRSVALDLATEQGREALSRLLPTADVVVENFLPAQLAALQLGALLESVPALVWCSIRAAGSDGPDGDRPGYDVMMQARSGLMSITGDPRTGPVKSGVAVCDVITGLYAAIAVVAALRERDRSGLGQRVEVPLLESAISAMANQAMNYLVGGVVPGLMGNRHPNVAPYGSYACGDQSHIVLGATSDGQFARLCEALGAPQLATDARFARNRDRIAHRAVLDAAVEELLGVHHAAEWMPLLQRAGVPCAPVNAMDEVFADPHVEAVKLLQRVAHPAGEVAQVRSPLRFSRTPASIDRPPPLLGEHTGEVLRALGLG